LKRIIEFFIALALIGILIYVGRPKLAALYYNQGSSYYNRGLYKEAINAFKTSLRVVPLRADTYYMLANAYLEIKIEDKAIEAYIEAIRINPLFIPAHRELVYLYWNKEMYSESLNQIKQAEIKIADNQEIKKLFNDVSFEYAADCLNKSTDAFLSKDKQKAYTLLNKALKIKPDLVYAHYISAYFYFSDNNYDFAEKELKEVIQRDNRFWQAYKLLGDIYFAKNMPGEAIVEYSKALGLNQKNATIQNDLGLALMRIENYDGAIAHLGKALELNPGNLNIRYSLASVYRDKGMLNDALSEYWRVIKDNPEYSNIHNDVGDIYKLQNKDKDSTAEYNKEKEYCQRKLSIKPNDKVLLNNLAYALNGLGEFKQAEVIIKEVIAMNPDYQQAYLTLAKITENLNNPGGASEALNKAKALPPKADFIDNDVARLKKELILNAEKSFFPTHIIYLKNGRIVEGRMIEEDAEKVVLEVKAGLVLGNITLYRNMIERIARQNQ